MYVKIETETRLKLIVHKQVVKIVTFQFTFECLVNGEDVYRSGIP